MSITRKTNPASKKQEKFARNRRPRQKVSLPTILSLTVIAGLILLFVFLITGQTRGIAGDISGVRVFSNLSRDHTNQPVTYAQIPPVGGEHHPAWQNCGVYTEPIPNENAVHSLEHGVIWITYRPDLPAGQLEQLQELTRKSGYRLLSPYPDLPSPVVASAWGYQLRLETADDSRLLDFISQYEQNPAGPEPGASCTGGVGNPG